MPEITICSILKHYKCKLQKFQVFPGLVTLRKICNHPDIATGGLQVSEGRSGEWSAEEREYGHWRRAGKMQVIHSLLKLWHKQGHRVLLFSQSRQVSFLWD